MLDYTERDEKSFNIESSAIVPSHRQKGLSSSVETSPIDFYLASTRLKTDPTIALWWLVDLALLGTEL